MQEIAYQMVRSNRKSVVLVIDNEANLIVRAPLQMQDAIIEEFVRKKNGGSMRSNSRLLSLEKSFRL